MERCCIWGGGNFCSEANEHSGIEARWLDHATIEVTRSPAGATLTEEWHLFDGHDRIVLPTPAHEALLAVGNHVADGGLLRASVSADIVTAEVVLRAHDGQGRQIDLLLLDPVRLDLSGRVPTVVPPRVIDLEAELGVNLPEALRGHTSTQVAVAGDPSRYVEPFTEWDLSDKAADVEGAVVVRNNFDRVTEVDPALLAAAEEAAQTATATREEVQ